MLAAFIQFSKDSWGLIPLLIIVFIIGLAVIIERSFFFMKSVQTGRSLEHDLQLVTPGNLQAAQQVVDHYAATVQGELVKTVPALNGKPEAVFERGVEEAIMFQLPRLDKRLWVLDTCVTLGPLLGLLGTIVHMIEAFSALSGNTAQGASSVVGPIAHALVATAAGLCIAIVCVSFLNCFNKRIRVLMNQMDLIKSMLISRFAVIV